MPCASIACSATLTSAGWVNPVNRQYSTRPYTAVGKLIGPAVCCGPFQHGRDVAGLGLQPGRGAGAVAAADLASGHGGEPGVVADCLVQVGGVGRMGGGDVLADRGQGAQPVALAEGQPELPQHGRRGQPVPGQQRGQVLAGDTVGEDAQQAQQPPRRRRSSAAR